MPSRNMGVEINDENGKNMDQKWTFIRSHEFHQFNVCNVNQNRKQKSCHFSRPMKLCQEHRTKEKKRTPLNER